MSKPERTCHVQISAYRSPWSNAERFYRLLWEVCWTFFCAWTPQPFNRWRLFWLRLFGCKMSGMPFVHQKARILIPWNLTLHDRACLGDGANAYTLGPVEIMKRATVAQEVYLCTGTHDFTTPILPLVTSKITIMEDAFIGARAFIMPGIRIGEGTIIGACSVVTKDMPDWTVCCGNPCKVLSPRARYSSPVQP
jgi:putative colanic acid biosynthesis acetyltransferase WcaF